MTTAIRPYNATDWPFICRIHDAARLFELRNTVGIAAFLTLEETAEPEGLFDAQLDVLEIEDSVVGFVAYSADELTWLYVDPLHFGKGFGRQLLRHAIKNSGPVFRTEVLEGNQAATNLYFREGFTLIRRIEGKLTGNEIFPAVGLYLEHRKEA